MSSGVGVRHLDLFSGIGGFAVAAQRVGWQTIGFCEIDPFCLDVLERRFDCDGWFSLPGPFDGEKDGRWGVERFTELPRIAPDWIVIENVYKPWRRWMPELRRRLYDIGYSSLPLRVRASDVGAVHQRARGWVVANADCEQLRLLSGWFCWEGRQKALQLAQTWDSEPRGLGKDDGVPAWTHRHKSLGNAIVPQAAELIFTGINSVLGGLPDK